ncbi:MarR family transcriptional regulator [uncultured Sunxiuqinia sp.]|uniref:MarR family winged helix-turn-helix transcriptional regulator n=1 Tax=uncultured Sunxiuqinia sp. TaxID=1573825 RepID=UPI002AA67B4B|nr:MarR family transcriptional regulator [uncultured Sunxiuqinia sp.]
MQLPKPLGYLLGQTMRIFKHKLTSKFKENNIDLSLEFFLILLQLYNREDVTQQDLSNQLQRDKSIVLRQVNALLEKRFVVRLPDKIDKRKKNLILTQKGYELLLEAKDISRKLSDELLTGLAETEIDTFLRVLQTIQANSGLEEDQCHC